MNKIIFLIILILSMSITANSQTLWLPFGSSDIGDSPNYNVGIGIDSPESNLHLKGDGLSFWISRSTYLSIGSEIGMDFRQLTNNGVFRTGGAIKSISTNSYTGGNGSTYDSDLVFYSSGDGELVEGLRINSAGSVGIGTNNPDSNYKLSVNGSIRSKEVKVEANWPDFVFENNYELRTLEEVEEHISKNGHLPEIPSEAEVTENGINLGEMNAKLLQKIEELTLYLIEQNKDNQKLQKEVELLKEKVQHLENQ